MHVGVTKGDDCNRPFAAIGNHVDGAISADGRVFGTYVHGLFADDGQRSAWLQRLGGQSSALNYEAQVDAVLDRLADHMERHLDLDALLSIAR
jgi:adenosylcobyric acid synthase